MSKVDQSLSLCPAHAAPNVSHHDRLGPVDQAAKDGGPFRLPGHRAGGNLTPLLTVLWVSLALGSGGCSTAGQASWNRGPHTTAMTVRGQDEPQGLLGEWAPSHLYEQAKKAAGYGPNEQLARQHFQQAERKFNDAVKLENQARRDAFLEAATLYAKAAQRWPDSALEEDALFMLGESNFFADRYPKAAEAYERLVKKYENTRHLDTVDARRFALARYWILHHEKDPDWLLQPNLVDPDRPLFDKFGHGVRLLNRIRLDDPTGKLADDATMAAGIAYFRAGKYLRADELFTDMRRSFPNSPHQFQAHLLGLKCKLKIYQGPQYSLTPMDDAELLIKQIQRQFPQEAQEHAEFLKNAWKEVRMNKALYDWELARYYDNRRDYGAARAYYEQVQQKYQDTNLAGKAAERLAEIANEPAKPTDPLPWLTRLFPGPDEQKPLVAREPDDTLRR